MRNLDNDPHSRLNKVANILLTYGWRLASSGAETRVIMQALYEMARALDAFYPEITLTSTVLTIKICDNQSLYAICYKSIHKLGINMSSLTRLYQLGKSVSAGKITDLDEIYHKVRAIRPTHYNKSMLVALEAIAASCFAYCNGGNLNVCLAAFFGGSVLMFTRFFFISKGYFENIAFMLSAFFGCFVTYIVSAFILKASLSEIELSVMATTLLLVPGFPYMNGFLDVIKGYLAIGSQRLFYSVLLTASASIGLLGALCIMHGYR